MEATKAGISDEEFRKALGEIVRRAEQVEQRIEELLEKVKKKAPYQHGEK